MKSVRLAGVVAAVVLPLLGCEPMPQTVASYPAVTGWVVDQSGKLSNATKNSITAQSKALAVDGPEVAVAVIADLGDETVEQYSIHLADKWKVGKKGKDNGVILLIGMAQRKIRIEVGTGLEPVLNDAKAGRIINDVIRPRMKAGDVDGAVYQGYLAILQAIKGA